MRMTLEPKLKMQTLLISASSRNDGDTAILVTELIAQAQWDFIDLADYDIGYYDYTHQNQNDDYLTLMRSMVENYDTLVFVTPVYWYAMSGILKVFFDRITDLLEVDKEIGLSLRGKKMAAITTSIGDNLGEAFWLPFSETAKYLGMEFVSGLHTVRGEKNKNAIAEFIKTICKSDPLKLQ